MSTQHIYKTLENFVNALNDLGNRVNMLANDVAVLKGKCDSGVGAPAPVPVPVPAPAPASIDYSNKIASIEAKLVKLDAQESKKMFENVLMIKVEALVSKMIKDRVENSNNKALALIQVLKKESADDVASIKRDLDVLRNDIVASASASTPTPTPTPITADREVAVAVAVASVIEPELVVDDDSFQVDIVNTKKKSSKKSGNK
jgi:hypothetical protein